MCSRDDDPTQHDACLICGTYGEHHDGSHVYDAPVLYWSEDGEVACEQHAPARISDTWRRDGWAKVKPAEVEYVLRITRYVHGKGASPCDRCREAAMAPTVGNL